MKRFISIIFICFSLLPLSAQNVNLSGRIYDCKGEAIVGAAISIKNTNTGAISDEFGYFNITVSPGTYTFEVHHIAYKPWVGKLTISRDTSVIIKLSPLAYELTQITVSATNDVVKKNNLSVMHIPVKDFMNLPIVLGETDVFKNIQILPGIQPGLEGSSRLNVRGSSPDQNLVLVDGMPIYYVSHIYGFESTFNSRAIKSMKVYKGNIPAKYSNLGSSVIDITMEDGDLYHRHFSYNMGLLSSNISYQGYLTKGKSSFTAFFRKSYIDLIILGLSKMIEGEGFAQTYGFYDFNTKFRFRINKKNSIYFSFFSGQDNSFLKSEYSFYDYDIRKKVTNLYKYGTGFGNKAFSFRWFSQISPKLIFNSVIGFSQFMYENLKNDNYFLTEKPDSLLISYKKNNFNKLFNFVQRNNFSWFLSKAVRVNFGIVSYFQNNSLIMDNLSIAGDSTEKFFTSTIDNVLLLSPYTELNLKKGIMEFKIGGVGNYYILSDTNYYYPSLRASLKINTGQKGAFQLSYSQVHQLNHNLVTSAIAMPSDLRVASNAKIPPVNTEIYDISYLYRLKNFSVSLSGYYKKMDNLIMFKIGTDILRVASHWSNYVSLGSGYSYGAEILISKTAGRLKGWLSYTYSRSFRRFPQINFGQLFPYRYDRPHIFNLAFSYNLSSSWQFSSLFTFYSGHNITLPTQIYIPGFVQYSTIFPFYIEYYSHYNNIRTPPYHRLDIAFNYHRPGGKSYWSFGIYNVYNRLNPTYLEPAGDGKLTGISLFPIMPFVSYRLALEW